MLLYIKEANLHINTNYIEAIRIKDEDIIIHMQGGGSYPISNPTFFTLHKLGVVSESQRHIIDNNFKDLFKDEIRMKMVGVEVNECLADYVFMKGLESRYRPDMKAYTTTKNCIHILINGSFERETQECKIDYIHTKSFEPTFTKIER